MTKENPLAQLVNQDLIPLFESITVEKRHSNKNDCDYYCVVATMINGGELISYPRETFAVIDAYNRANN